MIDVLVFVSGLALTVAALLSAIRTFILPRSARSLVTAAVFRLAGRLFRLAAGRSYRRQDRVMALFAPVTLVVLAGVWLALVLVGYSAMFWALGYGSVADVVWVSGSSLMTLGSAGVESTLHRVLTFTEAALGFGLVALLISFLPSLYSAFARREQLVALLEVRAGTPASAVEMLIRFHRIGWSSDLSEEWARWETWFVDIDESHTSYPSLVWLRSPVSDRSWVTAAGTVLDAASLWTSAVDAERDPRAQLCIRSGFLALRRIADFFGISHDPDPQPTDPISIGRSEFEAAVSRLEAAGVPIVADREAAWEAFNGWRVNYDAVLLRLSALVFAPYAPWTADRSAPDHLRPRLRRWGSRR